jgi:hypothetical protein
MTNYDIILPSSDFGYAKPCCSLAKIFHWLKEALVNQNEHRPCFLPDLIPL